MPAVMSDAQRDRDARESVFQAEYPRYLDEWMQFLSFPSVSAAPEFQADCRACADWLAAHLQHIGMASQVLESPAEPIVLAHRGGLPSHPAVLVYGHYDVQPAAPEDAWKSPPFQPELRGGRLYARGAEDNKGQLFYVLKAVETLIRQKALRCPLYVLIEGGEESGSSGLKSLLPQLRRRLRSDVLIVTDTQTVNSGAPTLIMGLRGIVHLEACLRGPHRDLHSGVHGGVAPNPASALAAMVAALHDADGRIAIPGLYEGVRPPTRRERQLMRTGATGAEAYRAATGVSPAGGERAFPPEERAGFRPSLDVNGLFAGYTGKGIKTIIPATARVKLTARLVAGQDPQTCLNRICEHLRSLAPPELTLDIVDRGVGGAALRLRPDSALIRRAADILQELTGKETVFLWEGASIPIVAELAAATGAEPLLAGFGHEDDNIHAPNESFSIDQFRQGYLYAARLLASF